MKKSAKITVITCLAFYIVVLAFLFTSTHHSKLYHQESQNIESQPFDPEIAHDHAPLENVTIAILAKDKAHTLPLYLTCLEKQTWPKEKTNLYIRTNNNNDNTVQILKEWVEKVS